MKTELLQCGDTKQQGLVIWLGTKSKVKASIKANQLIDFINAAKGKQNGKRKQRIEKSL